MQCVKYLLFMNVFRAALFPALLGLLTSAVALGMTKRPPVSPRVEAPCSGLTAADLNEILKLSSQDDPNTSQWKKLEAKVLHGQAACATLAAGPRPEFAGCMDSVVNFVTNQRQSREEGHSMGFLLSNNDYLSRQPKEMITFPLELQNGLPENWRGLCKAKRWDCVEFVSKSLPNPPVLSFRRLLIRQRLRTFDRWMLFTLPENGTAEHLIDFLGVERFREDPTTGELIALDRPKLHFVEYWRDIRGKNPVYRKQMAACYRCHPSGMRDIVPAAGSVDAEGLATIQRLNAEMAEMRPFDWGQGTVVPEAYGPPMGKKLTCIGCHDGAFRGVLNGAHLGERSRHQIYFKMVQDLTMPPARSLESSNLPFFEALQRAGRLTEREREKLYGTAALRSVSGLLRLRFGGDEGPMAASNPRVLKTLKKGGHLSSAEFDEAVRALERAEKSANQDYEQLKSSYRETLTAWLRGGDRRECAGAF